jgi:PAS domain S-box-containing protein/diguanylate cyclase (GGDEF)-like protein
VNQHTELEIFRAVIENAPIGICLVDRERQIFLWNRAAERITGYLRQELVGRKCSDDVLVNNQEGGQMLIGAHSPLTETIREGRRLEAHVYLHHKDGHQLGVQLWASPLRNEQGAIFGAVECFEERKVDAQSQDLAAYGCLDAVTELPNPGFTRFYLGEALNAFAEYRLPFCVLRVKIREFSQFRSTRGKAAADKLLHMLGQTLKHTLAADDVVGRWQEDEFLIVAPGRPAEMLRQMSEEIRAITEDASISWWGDQLSVQILVMAAAAQPQDTLASLLERSDPALDPCLGTPLPSSALTAPSVKDGKQCS